MNYLFVLAFVILAAGFVFGAIVTSRLLAPVHPGKVKNQTFECGIETIGTSHIQFNVGYYLFALLFWSSTSRRRFSIPGPLSSGRLG